MKLIPLLIKDDDLNFHPRTFIDLFWDQIETMFL